jgi:hypothetical protein
LGFLACAIWIILLDRENNPATTNTSMRIGLNSLSAIEAGTWILFRIVGAVPIVPIAEELAFRGYIIRRLPPGLIFGCCNFAFRCERYADGIRAGDRPLVPLELNVAWSRSLDPAFLINPRSPRGLISGSFRLKSGQKTTAS